MTGQTNQESAKLTTANRDTESKSGADRNSDNEEKSESEDDQNEGPEKEKTFNPYDPFTILMGLVWLFILVKIYFYLTASTVSILPERQAVPEVVPQAQPSSGGEYFTSIIRMKELVRLEQSIVAEMKEVVNNDGEIKVEPDSSGDRWLKGILKIKTYLRDYDSSIRPMLSETSDIEQVVVSHPLISFRMLRRIVANLPDILQYNVDGRLSDLINVAALIEPAVTIDDVVGAIEGILRLQTTFLISPYDFAHGRLQNYETKSGLTETDCFLIGASALNMNQPASAIEWFLQALRMLFHVDDNTDTITIGEVRKGLRNAIAVHNKAVGKQEWTFSKAVDIKFSEMTKENENELMKKFPSHPSPPPYKLFGEGSTYINYDEINFNGLCRGEKLRNATLTKRLKCYYKRNNPFLAIKPLKVEVHSYDPFIVQFYELIPNYVIDHFKTMTSHQLERAFVSADVGDTTKSSVASKIRISCHHFIDERTDGILSRLPQLVHEATNLNLLPVGSAEYSQVSTYGAIGGYYKYHYDTIHESRYVNFHSFDGAELSRGDRIATIMFYLSDLKLGGGTAFPKIGVHAEPIKGSAIFWYNLKKNGQRHDYTMHGGCPVLLGEKWVINKWIRSGDQMFIRKCMLDSNK